MSITTIVVPAGLTKPAVKSMANSAYVLLGARPLYFPPGNSPLEVVSAYRFSAVAPNAAQLVAQQLRRHNKATITVQSGAVWDSTTDVVTFSTINKAVHTAEAQLNGAYFKLENPGNAEIGIWAAGVTQADTLTKFFDARTKVDHASTSIPFTYTVSTDVVGYELTPDALLLKLNDTVLLSYPLTFTAVITGTGVTWKDGSTTLTARPYSLGAPIVIPPAGASISLSITDNFTGDVEVIAMTGVTALVAAPVTVASVEVGDDFTLDLTDSITGGSSADSSTLVIAKIKGDLPGGIIVANNLLTGVFLEDGSFEAAFSVTDASGQTAELRVLFAITPKANVTIQPTKAQQDVSYNYKPTLPAGFSSMVLSAPTLPTGMTLNPSTGQFGGTPTVTGTFPQSVDVTVNGQVETIEFDLVVYAPVSAQYSVDGGAYAPLVSGSDINFKKDTVMELALTGGSGQYVVSANNGATVGLNNQVTFRVAGTTIVTVIDGVTGVQVSYTFIVTSQDSMFGFAVENIVQITNRRNRPLVTEVGKPLYVGFSAWIIRDFNTSQTLRLNSQDSEASQNISEGSPFAIFTAVTEACKIKMPRAKNFISEHQVTAAMFAAAGDIGFGLGRFAEDGLKYEMVLTTVSGVRKVELRHNGVLIGGSRQTIAFGQVIGFGAIDGQIALYIDGVRQSTLIGLNMEELDFLVYSKTIGIAFGGQITGLAFSITTIGEAAYVGTVHPQTGLYTPADENIEEVTIQGDLPATAYSYEVRLLVIRGTVMDSFRNATLQNKPLHVWIGDPERGNSDRLRFTENGAPDANQIRNAVYVGKLKASGKVAPSEKRTEFANDSEVYNIGYTIQKYTISGDILQVMNPNIVKTVVPFIEIFDDEIGSLSFGQRSSGCIPRRRCILLWESTVCSTNGHKVWDAIEFGNVQAFTQFAWEVGTEVATMLPMNIEAFPDEVSGFLWKFYRYDSQFVLVD